jgi:hypothetical protein
MTETTTVGFRLEQADNHGKLVYRPWSTRTLKLKVTGEGGMPALRIRPRDMRPDETKAGIFRGYASQSDTFFISWGGGHEEGPCVKAEDVLGAFERCVPLENGQQSTLFFNVSHVGPDVPDEATVILEAYEEDSGDVLSTLTVQLLKPAALPDGVVRLEEVEEDYWQVKGGPYLPAYDSRWWPASDVAYEEHEPVSLHIRRDDNKLLIYWADQDEPIATITDHTRPSILDRDALAFELFAFKHGFLALRSWFFWLDKNIGHGFFIGRHEVPDVERFDMLIRPDDGRVVFACTDAHWREIWGEVPDWPWPTIEASLGISLRVAGELLGKHEEGPEEGTSQNPLQYIELIAPVPVGLSYDKGTEAHLPMLHNVTQRSPSRMVSSDVRLG